MVAPRICLVPEFTDSLGAEALEFVASTGLELDEHQSFVLERALGRRKDGKRSAKEVAVVEPRQNGKNAILEARQLVGLFLLGERYQVHSAHLIDTSLEAFRRLLDRIEDTDLERQVKRVSRTNGREAIELKNGCRIRFRTRTKGGGRGFTGDVIYLDEAMILPEASFGSLLPSLSGNSLVGDPQIWYTGSAVDQFVHEYGIVLARVRERAIAKAPELAYFEWSLEGDDPETIDEKLLTDREAWAKANPALGLRIAEEFVELERRSLDPRTFAVERLGVGSWPPTSRSSEEVIDIEKWRALIDEDSVPLDPITFAFDVAPDRSVCSIAAAGKRADGVPHLEIVERKRGTRWVVDLLVELTEKHETLAVVCDLAGPAASLVTALDEAGIEVFEVSAGDYAAGCGLFFDSVEQGQLRHLGTPELVASLRGAARRPLGDRWAWSRKTSAVDISPLVAATLALWGAASLESVTPEIMIAV